MRRHCGTHFLATEIEKLYARMAFTSWSATMTTVYQDAAIAVRLDEGKHPILEPQAAHRAGLQVAGGKFALKTYPLKAGDAVELTNGTEITVEAHAPSEVMVFDLPGA